MNKKQIKILRKHMRFFDIRQMEIKFWCFLEDYSHNKTERLRDKQMGKICNAMEKAGFDSDDWNTVKMILDSLPMKEAMPLFFREKTISFNGKMKGELDMVFIVLIGIAIILDEYMEYRWYVNEKKAK